ncbi:hypothetical protein RFI_12538 [Reticulomyxa filosa]|uniref:Uncharacterized protein n=1 Tax=Reticulomyxa filosa TaxID=46433 RepID=X6NE68_RETFI|nr:hypothetical protein RFI_12538 [Reticulomyxa filosa]|eukprot:ETO24620.1 hypothetical protein RFI_12538 [Reticulomyxa filosa]
MDSEGVAENQEEDSSWTSNTNDQKDATSQTSKYEERKKKKVRYMNIASLVCQTLMPHQFSQEKHNYLQCKLMRLQPLSHCRARKFPRINRTEGREHREEQEQEQSVTKLLGAKSPLIVPMQDNNNSNINSNSSVDLSDTTALSHAHRDPSLSLPSKSTTTNNNNNDNESELKSTLNYLFSRDEKLVEFENMNSNHLDNQPPLSLFRQKNRIFFEPQVSPSIQCIIFGVFNVPKPLKVTFLETHHRILFHRATEVLLYIENHHKDLLQFYDKTSHIRNTADFTEKVPPEATYPQVMKKFEQDLILELEICAKEDLRVFLSIAENFRPNLYSLLYLNPVFEQEFEDILKYLLC